MKTPPSKLEEVRGEYDRLKGLQFRHFHTPQSQCWVELQCLRHHTLSFAQLVFCNLPEHFVVRDRGFLPCLRGGAVGGGEGALGEQLIYSELFS